MEQTKSNDGVTWEFEICDWKEIKVYEHKYSRIHAGPDKYQPWTAFEHPGKGISPNRKSALNQINRLLTNYCTDCPTIRLLNNQHIIPYHRDKLCIDYCLIGKQLQELGNKL